MKTSVLVMAAAGGVPGYYALSRFPPVAGICFFLLAGLAALCVLYRVTGQTRFSAAATAKLKFCGILRKIITGLQNGLVPAAAAAGLLAGYVNGVLAVRPLSPGLPMEKISSINGVLLDDPRALSRGGMAAMALRYAWAKNVRASASGTVTVFFSDESIPRLKEFGRGGEVFVDGSFVPGKSTPGNPLFSARSVHIVRAASPTEQFRTGIRNVLLRKLNTLDTSGLAAALLLGSRENLDGELARSYRDAGLSHVLALSGMHLAFFSGLLAFLLKRPLGKKWAALAGLCCIIIYTALVGPQPSLLRAALMYAMGAFSLLAGIRGITFTFLAAAFFIQTAVDPPSGFSISFILSYTALAGIALLGGKIVSLMKGHLPKALAEALAASAGAFIVTAPIVIAFFGVIRPAGIAAGLAVVPLTALFMAASLAALVLGGFAPLPFGKLLSFLERLIEKPVFAAAGLPGIKAPFATVLAISLILCVLVFYAEKRYTLYRSRLEPFA